MARTTLKKVVVSKVAIKQAGRRSTKASAELEGRVVPVGHRQSPAADAYLAKQVQREH